MTGLFIVALAQGKELKDVNKLRYILNQTITWESQKNEIQCFRCQQIREIVTLSSIVLNLICLMNLVLVVLKRENLLQYVLLQ